MQALFKIGHCPASQQDALRSTSLTAADPLDCTGRGHLHMTPPGADLEHDTAAELQRQLAPQVCTANTHALRWCTRLEPVHVCRLAALCGSPLCVPAPSKLILQLQHPHEAPKCGSSVSLRAASRLRGEIMMHPGTQLARRHGLAASHRPYHDQKPLVRRTPHTSLTGQAASA